MEKEKMLCMYGQLAVGVWLYVLMLIFNSQKIFFVASRSVRGGQNRDKAKKEKQIFFLNLLCFNKLNKEKKS